MQGRDKREMLGGPHRAQEGVLPQGVWQGGCPPRGSPHPPDLLPRVPSRALCLGKAAGSDSACGTEGLRNGRRSKSVGGGWWESPESIPHCVWYGDAQRRSQGGGRLLVILTCLG